MAAAQPAIPIHSDEEIILGLQTLNDTILRQIYHKSYPEIERMVRRNGGSVEDAEDVFQKALMILIEKVNQGKYNYKSTIYTYLYSIAENLWKNELKSHNRNKILVYDRTDRDYRGGEFIEIGGMIKIEEPEDFDFILKWLKGLSKRCNEIIEKRFYEGQDWETIAKSLGYANAESARNQNYKCIEKLRKKKKRCVAH